MQVKKNQRSIQVKKKKSNECTSEKKNMYRGTWLRHKKKNQRALQVKKKKQRIIQVKKKNVKGV